MQTAVSRNNAPNRAAVLRISRMAKKMWSDGHEKEKLFNAKKLQGKRRWDLIWFAMGIH